MNKKILNITVIIFTALLMLSPLDSLAKRTKHKVDKHKGKRANKYTGAVQSFQLPQHPNIGGLLTAVVRHGENFDPLKGVLAYDVHDGYLKNISVTGKIDTSRTGIQKLIYSVTNSRGDNKTIKRRVIVLPPATFASVISLGRRDDLHVIILDKTYLNRLSDDVTFIKPAVFALPGSKCYFKLIERSWDADGYTTDPPADNDWNRAKSERFDRRLYLCMRPRLDRWLKITVKNGSQTCSWVYGLKGDKGIRFHSKLLNRDLWHLSREVDNPETSREQFFRYAQGCSYWCPLPMWLERSMGATAHVTTIGNLGQAYNAANREEIHGFYTTIRSFVPGADKRSQSDENWAKIASQWDDAFRQAMNTSYHRSFQIPIAEMNGGSPQDFAKHFADYYRHIRKTFNPARIIVGTGLRGHVSVFGSFYDAKSPYFKAEWHKGHFASMFQRFESEDRNFPFIVMYPRINEVWSKKSAFTLFETHRRVHAFAKMHNVEAAILDKIGILGHSKDGEWSSFALPYYAMWFCYDGYDYLNNGPFFANDWDGDGLPNEQEYKLNTNPFHPDTDCDMIFDGMEVSYGLDPRNPQDAALDNDHDRISNFDEIVAATHTTGAGAGTPAHPALSITAPDGSIHTMSPNNPADAAWDPDQDLLPAWFEINAGLDPTSVSLLKNGNKFFIEMPDVARPIAGMIANFAYHYNLDSNAKDFDGDGTPNMAELLAGTDPTSPEKSGDPRRKQWADLGAKLFQKYFAPKRFKTIMNKRENNIDAVFAYSPTEHGITAEISIRALDCDTISTAATSDKIEELTARLILLLNELRRHPELWKDQQKIIAGVSVRTYLKRPGKPQLRQDRGLYTIYIPTTVFRNDNFNAKIFAALKNLSQSKPIMRRRCGAKGSMTQTLLSDSSGIKMLFINSLEAGYTTTFKKAQKKKQAFPGDSFDYNMFRSSYTKLLDQFRN